ncbi:MAG: hypothetical protein WCO17_05800 [Betaproteobacteria bacterium]
MKIKFCVITTTKPRCVTKEFNLVDGELNKATVAEVSEGTMSVRSVESPSGFAKLLMSLSHDMCLTYGIPPHDADLVTEKKWIAMGRPDDHLPRSKSKFSWPNGPGIMMLDYDAPKDGAAALSMKALIGALLEACPLVGYANLIWWPSTSSKIYANEKMLTGVKGQRIYLLVQDATDIERAGAVLNERLWALGYGRYEVSASGSLLNRPLFDSSVWQSNHIDFAAGANCGPGLEQRRGRPKVHGDDATFTLLNTRVAIPELSAEESRLANENKTAAQEKLKIEAEEIKRVWLANRTKAIVEGNPHLSDTDAKILAKRAVESKDLTADWPITIKGSDGAKISITVLEALNDPLKYDGALTLDHLEPEYDGGRFVGKLFLLGARSNLHSFAHGGANYRLHRHPEKIEIVAGKGTQTSDRLIEVLRRSPDIFDFGGELVRVGHAGVLHPLDENSLRYTAGGLTQFYLWKKLPDGSAEMVLKDPPAPICKNVLSIGSQRELKKLSSVISAPTLRPDGTVLNFPGYDQATQLLFDSVGIPQRVALHPTHQQTITALDQLWLPFSDFPFCGPLDRAVHLAALLTTAVRASLPSSPGFAYDAPVQGSGKTLLARCVGVLVQGADPSVWPHTAGRDDEEIRKRLFTVLRTGARILIWDNVVGSFDSAAMASCMTSPTLTDRILGQSASSTVPNRMMVILTGNNISLQGEMPRRILISRIDPKSEKPFARSFELDPYKYCYDHRQSMIVAALTLIRAYLIHGCSTVVSGSLASFEDWDAWVRRTVIYANELKPGMFGDVMEAVKANQAADPDREALISVLAAWEELYGSRSITVAELLLGLKDLGNSDEKEKLFDALESLTNQSKRLMTAKSVGRFLGYRRGRIAGGLVLEVGSKVNGLQTWRVKAA